MFGGVRKQTNTQTHWHPIALEEGLPIDWTYLINICHLAMHGIYKGEGREVLPFLLLYLIFALQDGIGFLTKDVQFLCNLLT